MYHHYVLWCILFFCMIESHGCYLTQTKGVPCCFLFLNNFIVYSDFFWEKVDRLSNPSVYRACNLFWGCQRLTRGWQAGVSLNTKKKMYHPIEWWYTFFFIRTSGLLPSRILLQLRIKHDLCRGNLIEVGRCLFADDWYHTACQFAIQLIVRWEYDNLLIGELLCQLEVWCSGFYTHLFGFIWPCHHAAVIVRENNDRLVLQVWPKDTLAWNVTVIAVNDAVHGFQAMNYTT